MIEPNQAVAAGLCAWVGLSLGLLGGGGSMLMVPVFVYAGRASAGEAIAMSLVIVGASSAVGAVRYLRRGFVNHRLVGLFVLPGSATSFAGARLSARFASEDLLFAFGVLMVLLSAGLFLNPPRRDTGRTAVVCRPGAGLCVLAGSAVGLLTGLLGVGGGFLIVPVIALLMKCSFYTAVGTSLAIMCVNAITGFIGHLSTTRLDPVPTALYLFATSAGVLAGAALSKRVGTALLQRGFAALICAVGFWMAARYFPYP